MHDACMAYFMAHRIPTTGSSESRTSILPCLCFVLMVKSLRSDGFGKERSMSCPIVNMTTGTRQISRPPARNAPLSAVILVSLLLFCFGPVSASTNYNYNAYKYDMAPTFTPDGRLLQVEYASTAAELSTPIVALQIDNETLVLMTLKSATTPQNRIIVLPTRGDGKGKEVHSSHVCIAMSGVLADSISLIQVGLKEASEHYKQFHAPTTALRLATSMANACQSHCFGGGIRPYGCTLLACGFTSSGELALYQTDPSGAILEATIPGSTPSSPRRGPFLRWLTGGSTSLQRKLRKQLDSHLYKPKETPPMMDMLAFVGRTLLKETQKQAGKGGMGGKDTPLDTISFEVVVMNRKLGCYRLSRSQIRAIMEKLRSEDDSPAGRVFMVHGSPCQLSKAPLQTTMTYYTSNHMITRSCYYMKCFPHVTCP
jgi:20S proteasome subunit alpha 2